MNHNLIPKSRIKVFDPSRLQESNRAYLPKGEYRKKFFDLCKIKEKYPSDLIAYFIDITEMVNGDFEDGKKKSIKFNKAIKVFLKAIHEINPTWEQLMLNELKNMVVANYDKQDSNSFNNL